MKLSFFIASSAMLALCLAGCKPDEPVKPELESLAFGKAEVELNVGSRSVGYPGKCGLRTRMEQFR